MSETAILNGVFTSSNLSGVMNELVAVIPTVLPVAIAYMGVRKAIAFVLGLIRHGAGFAGLLKRYFAD